MNIHDLVEVYRSLTLAKNKVSDELRDRLNWKELYSFGLIAQAILKYRETVNPDMSISDAKKAVEKLLKNN